MFAGLLGLHLLRLLVRPYHYNVLVAQGHVFPGPLAGSFPLLSLRTNKADVVVGVEKELAQRLDNSGERWRVDGR
jgi:hypothetical protein